MDILPLFWPPGVRFNDDAQVLHRLGRLFFPISRFQEHYPKALVSPCWRPRGSSPAPEEEIISRWPSGEEPVSSTTERFRHADVAGAAGDAALSVCPLEGSAQPACKQLFFSYFDF